MSRNKGMMIMLLLAGILSLTACGEQEQDQSLPGEELMTPQQANYETAQVEEGTYVKTASGSVEVFYPVMAELSWEKANAHFKEIQVKVGQEVKQGDVLVTFDIEESKADMEELKLQLNRAKEDVGTGKKERLSAIEDAKKNAEGLSSHELRIAELNIEKLQAEYEQFIYQSKREVTQLTERIEALEEEVADNTLTAPFDGVIDKVISYHPGDRVMAGQVLITMHATDQFFLKTSDNGNLRYHMEVTIEAGSKDNRKNFSGRVIAASNILPAGVSLDTVLIELEEKVTERELKISPKYLCNAEEVQNVLLADKSAVEQEDGKSFVYVLEEDMVQKRYVLPGPSNVDVVWVLDGLLKGQTLIIN